MAMRALQLVTLGKFLFFLATFVRLASTARVVLQSTVVSENTAPRSNSTLMALTVMRATTAKERLRTVDLALTLMTLLPYPNTVEIVVNPVNTVYREFPLAKIALLVLSTVLEVLPLTPNVSSVLTDTSATLKAWSMMLFSQQLAPLVPTVDKVCRVLAQHPSRVATAKCAPLLTLIWRRFHVTLAITTGALVLYRAHPVTLAAIAPTCGMCQVMETLNLLIAQLVMSALPHFSTLPPHVLLANSKLPRPTMVRLALTAQQAFTAHLRQQSPQSLALISCSVRWEAQPLLNV